MKFKILGMLFCMLVSGVLIGQETIPFDTAHWDIRAQGYLVENFEGKNALYLQNGQATLRNTNMLNGTIEFDIYLRDRRGFPGVRFRLTSPGNMELFYFRPHLAGKPDGNQATPVFNGLTGWQLYFGPTYSFAYDYKHDAWTHVKLVINDDQAQIYLDHRDKPHHSWRLKQKPETGAISIGASFAPVYFANFTFDPDQHAIVGFPEIEVKHDPNIISSWTISNKFQEKELENEDLSSLINSVSWVGEVHIEENQAANISRLVSRPDSEGNTVFAKVEIQSAKDQMKRMEFGYSDRVVAILNGKPLYRGVNDFLSRDYRYLGTIGLFDEVFLPLKKGKNTLLFAVSESFGGWGITGRLNNYDNIKITN